MEGIQVAAPFPAVPLHHDDLVHVPEPYLGLQAPLVGRIGGRHFGCVLCPARGQLCVGSVHEAAAEDVATYAKSRQHGDSGEPVNHPEGDRWLVRVNELTYWIDGVSA